MNTTRWILGAVLVGAVSVWGLTEAGASPFSTWILSDDLGNRVQGSAPEQSEWETDPGTGSNESGETEDGSATDGDGSGGGNNGHGNNEDGVDSSNPGQGKGGPNGEVDESCDGTGECVDDEIKNAGGDTGSEETTTEETKTNNGKGKGKKK